MAFIDLSDSILKRDAGFVRDLILTPFKAALGQQGIDVEEFTTWLIEKGVEKFKEAQADEEADEETEAVDDD